MKPYAVASVATAIVLIIAGAVFDTSPLVLFLGAVLGIVAFIAAVDWEVRHS